MAGSVVAPRARPASTVATQFSGRANSIGFFRWLLAFSVIFSHAGPIAGFYGQRDLGTQISDEQSLGGVAVAGFFFFSGFLITRSRARTGMVRYFWRRCLRIMPAFWTALLLTAFVLGPIAWMKEQGPVSGYWNAPTDSPLTYVVQNMFLVLNQRNIAQMGTSLPYADIGGYDWNGSAWTLQYEFKAYILVGILGLVGYAANRWVSTMAALTIMVFNAMVWSGLVSLADFGGPIAAPLGHPFLNDAYNPMLIAPFAFGMLFALWAEYIPVNTGLAVVAIVIGALTYDLGGWNVAGQYGFLYFLMWAAIRWTRLQHWEKYGDFSYGVYIFAWPLMQFCCYFGLEKAGMLAYFAVILVVTHAIAFLSWHLIEKPAMSLKDWSPAPLMGRLRDRGPDADPDNPPDDSPPKVPAMAGTPNDA